MDKNLVVDIKDMPCPKFKAHPFMSIEVDSLGAFSFCFTWRSPY
jgi:hypothetical protein